MKTLLIAGVSALLLGAGTAYAEGGCRYGSPASMAAHDAAESEPVGDEDSRLLALLRQQEEDQSEAPVVHN